MLTVKRYKGQDVELVFKSERQAKRLFAEGYLYLVTVSLENSGGSYKVIIKPASEKPARQESTIDLSDFE